MIPNVDAARSPFRLRRCMFDSDETTLRVMFFKKLLNKGANFRELDASNSIHLWIHINIHSQKTKKNFVILHFD